MIPNTVLGYQQTHRTVSEICAISNPVCPPVLGLYCLPELKDLLGAVPSVDSYVPADLMGTWNRWLADITIAYPMVIAGVGAALVFG